MSDEPLLKEDPEPSPCFHQVPGNMERVQENMHHLLRTAEEVDLETTTALSETRLTQGRSTTSAPCRLFSSADSIVNLNLLNNFFARRSRCQRQGAF